LKQNQGKKGENPYVLARKTMIDKDLKEAPALVHSPKRGELKNP